MSKKTKNPGERSVLSTIGTVIRTFFTCVLALVAIAMMVFTVVSVTTFDRNDRDLFGYKAFIVRSDSMAATDFAAGDLVMIKEVDPEILKEGDIIAFRSVDPGSFGETFTHKIRALTTTAAGEPAFVTYGTTTGVNDELPVTHGQVMGMYQFALKGVGTFFTFLKTVPGYICCIFIPFMLLIIIQGINSIRLFRKYKAQELAEIQEQREKEMDEMAVERQKLAAEREVFQQLLMELKEQMNADTQSKKTQEGTDASLKIQISEAPAQEPKATPAGEETAPIIKLEGTSE